MPNWILDLFMKVTGNNNVGWFAKYYWDKRYVWASSKDAAVSGCRDRFHERKK
jgi:hypothetical protein